MSFTAVVLLRYNFTDDDATPEAVADYIMEHVLLDEDAPPNGAIVLVGGLAEEVLEVAQRAQEERPVP